MLSSTAANITDRQPVVTVGHSEQCDLTYNERYLAHPPQKLKIETQT